MSEPGWYPDPSGAPGQFRYWDGSTWSPQTSGSPQAGIPGQSNQPPQSSRTGLVVTAVAVVALLVIGLVIWRANSPGGLAAPWGGGDTNTSTPTVSAWDETSSATPSDTPSATASATPSDDPSGTGGTKVACPDTEEGDGGTASQGRMRSGNVSVPTIASWDPPNDYFYLGGLTDVIAQAKEIVPGWGSNSALATTSKQTFPTVKRAAHAIADCLASSGYYRKLASVKNLSDEATTIDGRPAYRIRSNVYVDFSDPKITGDVIDVIVIDTGNADTFGVYVAAVTIGDAATQAEVDAVIADIRVGS